MRSLEGKVAIVTGASSGLGKGIAEAFSKEGAKLTLAARNLHRLNALADELQSHGQDVLSVQTDVTHEPEVVALFEKTVKEFGRLDILVNNAGVFEVASIEETTLEAWQRTLDVNLTGPFLCTREAMKIMKRQRAGRIVNIGSTCAQMPRPNAVAYNCTKIAIVALTKTTALEGREYGVVASCIHPGNVNTDIMAQTPNEPMMEVSDVIKVVMTMVTLPLQSNMIETIVLPVTQLYLGRRLGFHVRVQRHNFL